MREYFCYLLVYVNDLLIKVDRHTNVRERGHFFCIFQLIDIKFECKIIFFVGNFYINSLYKYTKIQNRKNHSKKIGNKIQKYKKNRWI